MDNHIEIVQLSIHCYFWGLIINGEYIASSRSIDKREIIITEAEAVSNALNLPVHINERKHPFTTS